MVATIVYFSGHFQATFGSVAEAVSKVVAELLKSMMVESLASAHLEYDPSR